MSSNESVAYIVDKPLTWNPRHSYEEMVPQSWTSLKGKNNIVNVVLCTRIYLLTSRK